MPMVPSSARCVATDALVIGYGSDLRGDDGAGRRVADHIEARQIAGVTVRSVTQLTPELALDIAGKDVVVFVDASVDDVEVTVRELDAVASAGGVMTHHGDPPSVLSMVDSVGDPPRRTYVVSIPATNFDLGTEVSKQTAAAVDAAVDVVQKLVRGGIAGDP